jgi:hypothetical protein
LALLLVAIFIDQYKQKAKFDMEMQMSDDNYGIVQNILQQACLFCCCRLLDLSAAIVGLSAIR